MSTITLNPWRSYRILNDGTYIPETLVDCYRLDVNRHVVERRAKPADLIASKTDWYLMVEERHDTSGVVKVQADAALYRTSGQNRMAYHTPTFSIDASEVAGKARAKIKDQKVNLAVFSAEFREVGPMFLSTARQLIRSFRSLKSGYPIQALVDLVKEPRTRFSKGIASQWLQYQYGFRPLMDDIYNLADASAQQAASGFRQRIKTRSSDYKEFEVTGNGTLGLPWRQTAIEELKQTMSVEYSVLPEGLHPAAALGFLNPAELVWELIPFSFVADWMFNVGSVLSSLDALYGVKVNSQHSWRQYIHAEAETQGRKNSYGRTRFGRSNPSTTLPFPKLEYKPSTSLKAVLNGLALLKQLR